MESNFSFTEEEVDWYTAMAMVVGALLCAVVITLGFLFLATLAVLASIFFGAEAVAVSIIIIFTCGIIYFLGRQINEN